jgi:2-keto-4-pentenoate hydratase/2-oxohepta-3-ene-1,7-dioic acid hydratase in catechol pathway
MKIARIIDRGKEFFGVVEGDEISLLSSTQEEILLGIYDERLYYMKIQNAKFLPPITPKKIIGLERNYPSHSMETGQVVEEPDIFFKSVSSLIGHKDKILIPPWAKSIDYEVELVIVIGRKGKDIKESDAHNYIFGFTIGNDITDREMQFQRGRWSIAKSYDTFTPLGPWIVTTDEIGNDPDLEISLSLNGNIMQRSRTSNMLFKPSKIVSFLSKYLTLYPGDLIFTGTPEGVGHFRSPKVYLRRGDHLVSYIERIGKLENYIY